MATTKTPQPKRTSPAQLLKEQKIAAYRERIAQDKEAISDMERERNAIANTAVIDLQVLHKTFGKGIVTNQAVYSIVVRFDIGDKRFVMPSAFTEGFLAADAAEINEKFDRYRKLGEQIMAAREDMSAAVRSVRILEKK